MSRRYWTCLNWMGSRVIHQRRYSSGEGLTDMLDRMDLRMLKDAVNSRRDWVAGSHLLLRICSCALSICC